MIQTVAEIDQETADKISGTEYKSGYHFAPTEDADGKLIISLQEAQYLEKSKWEAIDFNPKIEENEFTTEN